MVLQHGRAGSCEADDVKTVLQVLRSGTQMVLQHGRAASCKYREVGTVLQHTIAEEVSSGVVWCCKIPAGLAI